MSRLGRYWPNWLERGRCEAFERSSVVISRRLLLGADCYSKIGEAGAGSRKNELEYNSHERLGNRLSQQIIATSAQLAPAR